MGCLLQRHQDQPWTGAADLQQPLRKQPSDHPCPGLSELPCEQILGKTWCWLFTNWHSAALGSRSSSCGPHIQALAHSHNALH